MTWGQNFYFGIIPQKIWAYWKGISQPWCDVNTNYIKIELSSSHYDLVSFI